MSFAHPFARIVVAYDASPPADAALSRAVALAEQFDGEVVLAHVSDVWAPATLSLATESQPEPGNADPVVRGLDLSRRDLLEHAGERVAACKVPVRVDFSTNSVVAGVLDAARRWDATAIAVGRRDLSGVARALTGSHTEGILRNAEVPVIVVHDTPNAPRPELKRLLVGIDSSEPSEGAAVFAVSQALERNVRLIFCSVAETKGIDEIAGTYGYDRTPYLRDLQAAARDALETGLQYANAVDVFPDTDVVEAPDAASGLLDAAHRRNADAIVVGTHGRRHLDRFFFGSTAESVVCRSGLPVIVVPVRAYAVTGVPAEAAAT